MLVYRVEHPDSGQGPFTHGDVRVFNAVYRCCLNRHEYPNPEEEGMVHHLFGWVTGCNSKALLGHWFRKGIVIGALRECGFVINVYNVADDTIHGKLQSLFRKSAATLVETLTVDMLKDIPLIEIRLAVDF